MTSRSTLRWLRASTLTCCLTGTALFSGVAHAQPGPPGVTNKSTRLTDPGELYHAYCSVCHGERGDGRSRAQKSLNPPPLDFTNPQSAPRLSRERMIEAVRDGRPGTAMVGWKTQLSDERIASIVDYVRALFVNGAAARAPAAAATAAPAVPAAPVVDMQLPMPGAARPHRDNGRRLYDANCATCHGRQGDGKGPRAYFINPKPRDFLSADSRRVLNRQIIHGAVSGGKVGTEMPAWDKVLTAQQIADVSEYVFSQFITGERHAPARSR